jgi:hypothetical protein
MSRKTTAPTRMHRHRSITRYLTYIPKSLSHGKIVVHNRVRPQPSILGANRLGGNGFRAWTVEIDGCQVKGRGRNYVYQQKIGKERYHVEVEVCPCDWAPHLKRHYREVF